MSGPKTLKTLPRFSKRGHRNKEKAFNIAATNVVWPHLSGPKVSIFYENLLGDYSTPTIDSHAFNCWIGHKAAGSDVDKSPGIHFWRQCRSDYIAAAASRGYQPAAFQAILWVTHKRRVAEGRVPGYSTYERKTK
jgi:hypothetical protein